MTSGVAVRSVVLDVDSTLCGIEGIDWLASRRGSHVAEKVALETAMAMRGELPLEDIYERRLSLVRPARVEIELLGDAYAAAIAPDAERFISAWLDRDITVALLTSGVRQAISPLASRLGVRADRVYAVDVLFNEDGSYAGFDTTSPLTTAAGKPEILAKMNLTRAILTVGDGSTDLATRAVADAFAAFTGFVEREPVVRKADFVVASFAEIDRIITNGV